MIDLIDLTGDNELTAMCADWLDAKKKLTEYKSAEENLRTEIMNKLNKNQTDCIIAGDFEITLHTRAGSAGKAITLDDVGKVIGARAGSASIKINEIER